MGRPRVGVDWLIRSTRPLKYWRAVAVAIDGRGTKVGGVAVGRQRDV